VVQESARLSERFLRAQQAVENVMHAHTHTFLPEKIRLVGQGYILHGSQCGKLDFENM